MVDQQTHEVGRPMMHATNDTHTNPRSNYLSEIPTATATPTSLAEVVISGDLLNFDHIGVV